MQGDGTQDKLHVRHRKGGMTFRNGGSIKRGENSRKFQVLWAHRSYPRFLLLPPTCRSNVPSFSRRHEHVLFCLFGYFSEHGRHFEFPRLNSRNVASSSRFSKMTTLLTGFRPVSSFKARFFSRRDLFPKCAIGSDKPELRSLERKIENDQI